MEELISFLLSMVAPLIWYLLLLLKSHSIALGCQGRAQHLPGVAWVWAGASLCQQWPGGHRTIAWPELNTCNGHEWERLEKSLPDVSPGLGKAVVHLLGRGQKPVWRKQARVRKYIKPGSKISKCEQEGISTTTNIVLLLGKTSGCLWYITTSHSSVLLETDWCCWPEATGGHWKGEYNTTEKG